MVTDILKITSFASNAQIIQSLAELVELFTEFQ